MVDLNNMYIPKTNVTLASAPDHAFKKWVRDELTKAGYTPDEIETNYHIPLNERKAVISKMNQLGIETNPMILK